MIKLEDSQISQILPGAIKDMPEIRAMSYAINRAMKKMVHYSKLISVYAVIDELPEEMLNLLAVELRAQYYDTDLDIEKKRTIVKNTLLWYRKAGTPAAVKELIAVVFGTGEITEWYEYGGEPYYFKITTNTTVEEGAIAEFEKIINKVKNARSHLEAIELLRETKVDSYVGAVLVTQGKSVAKETEIEQPIELTREHWETAMSCEIIITQGKSVIVEEE